MTMCLKITNLMLLQHFPGANKLKSNTLNSSISLLPKRGINAKLQYSQYWGTGDYTVSH